MSALFVDQLPAVTAPERINTALNPTSHKHSFQFIWR